MKPRKKNLTASVHARLLKGAHARQEDFTLTLSRYAAERFLYRLGESVHREQFVLKGAMLYALWGSSAYRPTRDLDFTDCGAGEVGEVLECIRDICGMEVAQDGLSFDLSTLEGGPIRDDADYGGFRIVFHAYLGNARIPMQVDVGFGNAIYPGPMDAEYPVLLDAPAPKIRAYPQEAVIAEKLHAAVVLGDTNSRFKDFYDLHVLATRFGFDGARLTDAIAATFERRLTRIDTALPRVLTTRFYADEVRAERWRGYMMKNRLPGAPADFNAVGEVLLAFLSPPWKALASEIAFVATWTPRGPWQEAV